MFAWEDCTELNEWWKTTTCWLLHSFNIWGVVASFKRTRITAWSLAPCAFSYEKFSSPFISLFRDMLLAEVSKRREILIFDAISSVCKWQWIGKVQWKWQFVFSFYFPESGFVSLLKYSKLFITPAAVSGIERLQLISHSFFCWISLEVPLTPCH